MLLISDHFRVRLDHRQIRLKIDKINDRTIENVDTFQLIQTINIFDILR